MGQLPGVIDQRTFAHAINTDGPFQFLIKFRKSAYFAAYPVYNRNIVFACIVQAASLLLLHNDYFGEINYTKQLKARLGD